MKTPLLVAKTLTLLAIVSNVSFASPLEITIRAHTNKIMFGDPLCLEVMIVNTSTELALAASPDILAGTCGFMAREFKTNLMIDCSGPELGSAAIAGLEPLKYLPGKPVKMRWTIFAPFCHELNHPFWKAADESRKLQMWFVLGLEKKVSLRSEPIIVQLEPRDKQELKAIEKWTTWDKQRGDTNICPINFGVRLNAVNTKREAKEAASEIKSGELGELLRLIVQIQELSDSPEKREEGAATLVDWLKRQPDIKRQLMSRRVAQMYPWLPTQSLSVIKEMAETEQ